jgi:hypothetical protein
MRYKEGYNLRKHFETKHSDFDRKYSGESKKERSIFSSSGRDSPTKYLKKKSSNPAE